MISRKEKMNVLMNDEKEISARYAIDIRGPSTHVEAADLAELGSILHGHAGRAHVFDRQTGRLMFEGTVEEVRRAIDDH